VAYDAERILRAIQTLLQDELAGALDAVEALWMGIEPIALADPTAIDLGYKPVILELPSSSYPIISIFGMERSPETAQAGQWKTVELRYSVRLEYVVAGGDAATASLASHRYAEAIVSVLQSQRDFEGYSQMFWEPTVRLTEVGRHPVNGMTGDMFDDAEVDYIRLGAIDLVLEGQS